MVYIRIIGTDAGGKEVLMNGIAGVSFQEVPGGLKIHIRKSQTKSSAGKLKKRLPYNFKQMSKQIMQAKTSDAARPLVAKVQAKLSWLYKKLRSGEYGDSEIAAAIIHAAAMERIAKRKVRHLEEEEAVENGSGAIGAPDEDEEIYGKGELKAGIEGREEISGEMMKQMMEEIEELEEELAEEMMSELQDMISCASGDMTEQEIEELKRKHRNDEERQITRADLKYLKALFDRLEREKEQVSSGNIGYSSG
ncbi:MAG: hypothetical protein K6G03_01635, partial [Lachnospiraceae bacterium]|nr:hypothetical protein [Lachnospiraceae bacterium]